MIFYWNLSNSKSHQVSWTLLSILDDLYNAVVWMVSARPLISNSSSPLTNPLRIIPSTSVNVGTTDTFMFHSFFSSLARSEYLSLFSFFFDFPSVDGQDSKVHCSAGSLFCLLSLGLVCYPGLDDLFVFQNLREFCASHSPRRILFCAYIIWHYGLFKFLAQFPVDHLPHTVMYNFVLFYYHY